MVKNVKDMVLNLGIAFVIIAIKFICNEFNGELLWAFLFGMVSYLAAIGLRSWINELTSIANDDMNDYE